MKTKLYKYILPLMALACTSGMRGETHTRLLITTTEGETKVYDTERLSKMQFDYTQPVDVELSVAARGGYSVDIQVEKPEECASYTMAIARKSDVVDDWVSYIKKNSTGVFNASGTVKFGSLSENTEYVVAALATDKYGVLCSLSSLEVSTGEASASEKPKIGYVLFSDGTWAQRNQAGKTPVGIIFSLSPSPEDIALGYTHGYAMALKNAGAKVKWSTQSLPNQTGEYTSSVEYGFQTDMNGLTHTRDLLAQGEGLFPAAEMAAAYTSPAPSGSSGWYLPSSGQWFEICVNLGGLPRTMPRLGTSEGYWNDLTACSSSLSRINEYMSLTGTGNYEPITVSSGDYQWFWTSSESSAEQAYALFFDNDQLVVEIAGYFKNYDFASNRVRAVVAF